jgi:DNA-binding response OmpR family regulator
MKVLVIEDDGDIARILKKGLGAELCVVDVASSGADGIMYARLNEYDAIVLDLHLGDMRGDAVARTIRSSKPSIPILVLSVESAVETKIELLALCDDYMTKPFSLCELVMRLRAVTRRGSVVRDPVLCVGTLTLDSCTYTVNLEGERVQLRNKEFALLEYLMQHQGMVLSREMILSHVWDMHADPFTNTVDTHIKLLRKKLETPERTFIHTVPKRGYRFSLQ